MGKILFLESVAGIAGDMFAASFIDAGLITAQELMGLPLALGLEGVELHITTPARATMKTTHIDVQWRGEGWKRVLGGGAAHAHSHVISAHADSHWHTHYKDLDLFLERTTLDPQVKKFARDVFRLIGEAEAEAHGAALDEVAFHEVGAVDSIVDVVMAAYCIHKVKPSKVYASAVKLGRGVVQIAHGTHPVPPPAAARLAIGLPVAEVPAAITRPNVELSTPTGLAILKALNPTFVNSVPSGVLIAHGMGSGTMDLGAYPNVFRVNLLEEGAAVKKLPYESDRVIEIVCNVDDETAERVSWLMERLMALGALDVWATPVTGKKGRPGLSLSVLTDESSWSELADWMLRHSSTFGLRYRAWDRLKLARRIEKRATQQGTIDFKVGMTTDAEVLKEKPEYEQMRKIWEKDPSFRV